MNLPWYIKMGAKMILACIPLPHRVWYRLEVFRHGRMEQFDYA